MTDTDLLDLARERRRGDEQSAILELREVSREYVRGQTTLTALHEVDFRIDPGEFVAIVGPSGSGKSTMLNVLGLLDVPTSGAVYLHDDDVTGLTDRQRTNVRLVYVGFVFQDFHLIPSLTAEENVELPGIFDHDPDAGQQARDLLDRVGLGHRLDHYPEELSGGQQQRVAVARSLMNDPAVVLADEPTGNLDRETGRTILSLLTEACQSGVGVVVVTHDPVVEEYVDRTVEIIDGELTK